MRNGKCAKCITLPNESKDANVVNLKKKRKMKEEIVQIKQMFIIRLQFACILFISI